MWGRGGALGCGDGRSHTTTPTPTTMQPYTQNPHTGTHPRQRHQALRELQAALRRVLQQPLLRDHVQRRDGGGAPQRAATVGAALQAVAGDACSAPAAAAAA